MIQTMLPDKNTDRILMLSLSKDERCKFNS